LEVDDVRWCTYDDRREALPFQEIYAYYGWVLYRKQRVYRHLLKRVKMQYGYDKDIPSHPSSVVPIPIDLVVHAFFYYRVYCICEDQWGPRANRPRQHVPGNMAWYVRMSHPKILPPDDGFPPRPTIQEELIEQGHDKEIPDTLELIRDCVRMKNGALASRDELSIEDLLQVLSQINCTGWPTLTYFIAR